VQSEQVQNSFLKEAMIIILIEPMLYVWSSITYKINHKITVLAVIFEFF